MVNCTILALCLTRQVSMTIFNYLQLQLLYAFITTPGLCGAIVPALIRRGNYRDAEGLIVCIALVTNACATTRAWRTVEY